MNKIKYLKKYQIVVLAFFQIFFIIGLLNDILKNSSAVTIQNSLMIGYIITGASTIVLYGYIAKKFWDIRIYVKYKIFTILNAIYIINMLLNLSKLFMPTKYFFNREITLIVVIFLVLNLVLILLYNKNVRALKSK